MKVVTPLRVYGVFYPALIPLDNGSAYNAVGMINMKIV